MTARRIVTSPAFDRRGNRLHGRFEARLDGQILCVSAQPMLDSARVLLDRGAGSADSIAKVHAANPDIITMSAPIGIAARYTVQENERVGPRFVRWKAFPRGAVPSPVRSDQPQAPDTAADAEALGDEEAS
jgi:hypothetical protein